MALPSTITPFVTDDDLGNYGPAEPAAPPLNGAAGTDTPAGSPNPIIDGDSPSAIYAKIQESMPVNYPLMLRLGKQASLLTAALGDQQYGTLTAAKPSPKPMVFGFIVPDVPINYSPVSQVKSKVGDVNKASAKAAGTATSQSFSVPGGTTGPPGMQPKTRTTFGASDLKNNIIAAYTQITGHPPTPQTTALIYAQMCLENGVNAGTKSFGCYNYNLGNFHAGGGTTPYAKGEPLPPPNEKTPKGGSYFWTTDYDSKGQPYGCYMQSYGDLGSAVRGQVGQLLHNWPGTATAQTPEEFNSALVPPSRGGTAPGPGYYEAPVATYLAAIKSQVAAYNAGGQASGTADASVQAQDPEASKPEPPGPPIGAIMDNGDVTGADGNPLGQDYGHNIQVDLSRKALTDSYIASIREDISMLKLIPPLLLLVNPQSFERSYEQSVDSGPKGRQGHIVHLWMEKPLSISCKGVTAGQYIIDAEGQGGLAQTNRISSLSYQNLLSLVMTYKNNGVIFDKFSADSGSLGVPIVQMSIYIYYDGRIYIGSFDDFSVDDAADKPYNLDYSFKFNVRYEVEVDPNAVSDAAITGVYAGTSLTTVGSQLNEPPQQVNNPGVPPLPPAGTL